MQLGISSYTFTWAVGVPGHPPERPMSPLDLLRKAVELGVRLVQVADNLPLDQLSPVELDAFQRRASELNVSIEVGTRGIDPHHLATYLRDQTDLAHGTHCSFPLDTNSLWSCVYGDRLHYRNRDCRFLLPDLLFTRFQFSKTENSKAYKNDDNKKLKDLLLSLTHGRKLSIPVFLTMIYGPGQRPTPLRGPYGG